MTGPPIILGLQCDDCKERMESKRFGGWRCPGCNRVAEASVRWSEGDSP